MQGLIDPARHEPLQELPWSEGAARAAIARICGEALAEGAAAADGRLAHPLDDAAEAGQRYFSLYEGTGGVLWALHHLQQVGAIDDTGVDYAAAAGGLVEANRPGLAGSQHGQASYLLGDAGLLLLRWRLAPEAATEQALHDCVRDNLPNPVREPLWGSAGTLLAAIAVAEAGPAPRWAALVREGVQRLWDEMERDPETGTWVWVQDLYGRRQRLLGAGHGFAGNVFPALRARALLPAELVCAFEDRALETLLATALRAPGLANWHPMIDAERVRGRLPLVQDCHGSPGIVLRLHAVRRHAGWDELLRDAGELTWRAGPLSKGPTWCHGTAGSAWACLKLARRFGHEPWLGRARTLALHAAQQVEAARRQYGRGRHSLWTGDLGVACLLWACLSGDDRVPTLDGV